ncbi:hypothetical protein [Azospirillum picis]|uniref:O-antigen ligase domain-containing protein n=1 Tax=Azospirillum picis TaxID=488438 RepID=A0ABU0MGN8_9PROT|nr:hypothetical protein [Azospirillum picis]MBP2298351.1 hypothetical protein [Azospirillum picis]MDQ0532600.1 hypothetical protein [Azospirillum picis]
MVALLLYGALSVPAPQVLRTAEAAIGSLIAFAVGWRWPAMMICGQALPASGGSAIHAMPIRAFALLLWLPMLRGAALGWPATDILRDIVPLLYLFLPLLLAPALRAGGSHTLRMLGGALALAGLLLAVRWWRQMQWDLAAVGVRAMADGSVYLLNAPAVLFAGVALPALGLSLLGSAAWKRSGCGTTVGWQMLLRSALLAGALACVLGGLLCLGALAGAVHRTALGLAVVALAAIGAWWVWRSPRLALPILLVIAVMTGASGDPLSGAWDQAAEKTRLTGMNARFEEAAAVIDELTASPWTLVFGEGWGARIANPAVGGWRVGYTHTLASYALLKTGILGTFALIAYLGFMMQAWFRLLAADPPLALTVMPPLLMALGLHTSFKYLDTGLILTLTLLGADHRKGLPINQG